MSEDILTGRLKDDALGDGGGLRTGRCAAARIAFEVVTLEDIGGKPGKCQNGIDNRFRLKSSLRTPTLHK